MVLLSAPAPNNSRVPSAEKKRLDQLPILEVTAELHFPSLRSKGEVLKQLPPGRKRSEKEARRLMVLSSHIRAFRDLKAELGPEKFAEAHLAICAEMQPRWIPAGELLFSGMQTIRSPLLILAGEATLLAQRHPSAPQPEEAAVLLPGEIISNASLSWLQPLSIAAIARTQMQLLVLPGAPFAEKLQMPLLRVLAHREQVLAELPLLEKCPASGLRALAHAAEEILYAPDKPICAEDEACEDMLVLTKGTASVKIRLGAAVMRPKPTPAAAAALAKSGKGASAEAPAKPPEEQETAQLAEVKAPELLCLIDVMQALLQRGREAQDSKGHQGGGVRRAHIPGVTTLASPLQPGSGLGAKHGASVITTTPCRALRLRTEQLLRHAGPEALLELASNAHDRSIIRSSLRTELLRQTQRKRLKAQQKKMYAETMGKAMSKDDDNNNNPDGTMLVGFSSSREMTPTASMPSLGSASVPNSPMPGRSLMGSSSSIRDHKKEGSKKDKRAATSEARSRRLTSREAALKGPQLPSLPTMAPPPGGFPPKSVHLPEEEDDEYEDLPLSTYSPLKSPSRGSTARSGMRSERDASTPGRVTFTGPVFGDIAAQSGRLDGLGASASAPILRRSGSRPPTSGSGVSIGYNWMLPMNSTARVMTTPLLPPAVGTLDQLKHARSSTRHHNLRTKLNAIENVQTANPAMVQADLLTRLAETYCDGERTYRSRSSSKEVGNILDTPNMLTPQYRPSHEGSFTKGSTISSQAPSRMSKVTRGSRIASRELPPASEIPLMAPMSSHHHSPDRSGAVSSMQLQQQAPPPIVGDNWGKPNEELGPAWDESLAPLKLNNRLDDGLISDPKGLSQQVASVLDSMLADYGEERGGTAIKMTRFDRSEKHLLRDRGPVGDLQQSV